MFRTLTAASALTIVCAPAFSQGLSFGSVDLDYSQLTGDGVDISNTTLQGELEYDIDQFLLGGSLNAQRLDGFGGSEISITGLSGFVAYAPTAEILVGAGVSHMEIESGGGGGGDLSGFEVFAQYQTPNFGAAINYSEPDSDESDFSIVSYFAEGEVGPGIRLGAIIDDISEVDEAIYYVSADYEQGPLAVRGFYNGVTGEDFAIYGVRGSYAVTPMIDATASIAGFQDFLSDEGTTVTVGGSYAVSNDFSFDGAIGRLSAGANDVNFLQVGVTYDIGASKRLDTTMKNAVLEDRNNGLRTAFPNLSFGGTSFPLF